jgi:hypothetical protein
LLPIPGSTSFLLIVQNTGNAEESYKADLTGSTGPVQADLLGLDGLPTTTIPTFILPGLSTGEIVIQANLLGAGSGTVSVQVQSLTSGVMAESETATVSSTPATTIQLVPPSSPTTVGQPVTYTAIVRSVDAAFIPSGKVTFVVDGVPQSPEPLTLINGLAAASFTTSFLSSGVHHVSVSFTGADFAPARPGRSPPSSIR